MIFFIRFVTATCLFSFLGKANLWLNPFSNILLAFGYRFFLIFSPLFDRLKKSYAIALSIFSAGLGSLFFLSSSTLLLLLGAFLVALGLSVSGYLIKLGVAESASGAAWNKIALNAGSLLAGLILLLSIHSKYIFFGVSAFVLIIISSIALFFIPNESKKIRLSIPSKISIRPLFTWILVGCVTGIKLFAVFSVLPQYLIYQFNYLPHWYGVMVFLNSIVIVLFQMPIIHQIKKIKGDSKIFILLLGSIFIGMFLISFPRLLYAENFFGALVWTSILSVIECMISYFDVQASVKGYLFIKEVSVGLGAGATVLCSRMLIFPYSAWCVGVLGLMMTIGIFLFASKN